MKKWKIYSIIVSVILVIVIVGIILYSLFRVSISEDEAKNIAISYANVQMSDVTMLSINKDRDDRVYEIHFYDDLYEYEVDVNYINGTVSNFEKDIRDNVSIDNSVISMTEDEAKDIALQRVGKSSDEVTFTRVREDRVNGVTVYDVYFYDNEKEYELSIDVNTKEIVSYKENYLRTNNGNNNSNNNSSNNTITTDGYIGIERAKEIVLDHAGVKGRNVTFSKVELDVDYQIATYEIKFYCNYYEYEYEINAVTGEILKYERER